jgi:hypothetical protein
MHGFLRYQAFNGTQVVLEVIRVHMLLKTRSALPSFVKNEHGGIDIVLMKFVFKTAILFPGWFNQLQQLGFDRANDILLCYDFCDNG